MEELTLSEVKSASEADVGTAEAVVFWVVAAVVVVVVVVVVLVVVVEGVVAGAVVTGSVVMSKGRGVTETNGNDCNQC